uniref:Uncharacterized protein n=1 Tax=Magallana gigas TaxID=29159 RepID=K1R3F3_MAGGI
MGPYVYRRQGPRQTSCSENMIHGTNTEQTMDPRCKVAVRDNRHGGLSRTDQEPTSGKRGVQITNLRLNMNNMQTHLVSNH